MCCGFSAADYGDTEGGAPGGAGPRPVGWLTLSVQKQEPPFYYSAGAASVADGWFCAVLELGPVPDAVV